MSSDSRTLSSNTFTTESLRPTITRPTETQSQRQAARSESDLLQWPVRNSSRHEPPRYRRRQGSSNIFDNDLPPLPISEMSSESRRQSIIAMDRKRRLTGSLSENGRRRTVSGGYRSREDQSHYQQTTSHDSNQSQVIDLTSPSPELPPTGLPDPPRRSSSHNPNTYVVPRWQPDSDVSECPICHRQFGIIFRRHHCRKCGRVVCNDCSPHRITIPRQFIVHPPNAMPTSPSRIGREIIDLTRDDDDTQAAAVTTSSQGRTETINSALGGGEKVRLCNPCVPDPQPETHLNYSPSQFSSISVTNPSQIPSVPASTTRGATRNLNSFPHPGTRIELENEDDEDDSESSSGNYNFSRSLMNVLNQHRYSPSGPMHSRYHSIGTSQPPHHTLPVIPHSTRPRVRSMLDPLPFQGQNSSRSMVVGSLPTSSTSRPSKPRIREEDICPICRRELPAKDLNGDETARERHIMLCISRNDASAMNTTTRNQLNSQTETHTVEQSITSQSVPSSSSNQRGPMQMLRFIATEKDCIGEDGNVQECSICMIEYDVGDQLARLECWCKFHNECIVEWFTRKRECPVHKIA